MKDISDLSVIKQLDSDFVRKFKFAYIMNSGRSAIIITNDDSVYVCGNNNRGCLGLGHEESVETPTKLEQLCNKKVINIIDDNWYMYALTSDGHIYFWGYNNKRIHLLDCNDEICLKPTVVELLMDKFMVNIACGDRYWLGLTINGEVYEWGLSFISETAIPYPQLVSELKLHTVVEISCGSHHAIALTDSGVVFSWGSNEFGQLGCGSNDYTEDPIKVEGEMDYGNSIPKMPLISSHSKP